MNNPTPSRKSIAALALLLAPSLTLGPANASDLTLRQVVETLFKAPPASQPDFADKDLSSLDLSGLDFKQARLTRANLLGADLTDANLSKADLRGAKLDRSRLTRTNFSGANLVGASLYHAVGTLDFEAHSTNAPNFSGANLRGARIMARLSRADLRGANLADARLGPCRAWKQTQNTATDRPRRGALGARQPSQCRPVAKSIWRSPI